MKLIHKTQRLTLRPLQQSDFKLWQQSNEDMLPSQNTWDTGKVEASNFSKKNFNKLLKDEKLQRDHDDFYSLYAFDKKKKCIVGSVAAMNVQRGLSQSAFLGYYIHNNHWGKGYGKESVEGFIHFAFKKLKLHRLEAGIEPTNKRSIYLVKSLGLRKEGFKKRIVYLREKWIDLTMYSITCEELGYKWNAKKAIQKKYR